ncbi:hypothetical protein T484DRAFT_1850300 [Baffinella frigidus]|nr:hypothetical protein T484DRAFT_1850300 [Cryptophyta sp. CCMP2293]
MALEDRAVPEDLFLALEDRAVETAPEFPAQAVANVLWALATLGREAVANVVWALATLGREAVANVVWLATLGREAVANVLWARDAGAGGVDRDSGRAASPPQGPPEAC